jgi:hypothetical protein
MTVLGVLLVLIGLAFFLFVKPSATPIPPISTATPIPTSTPAPNRVETGAWETSIAFIINDQTNLVSLSFTVGENGDQIDSWSLFDLGAGQITMGGSVPIVDGTFKIQNISYTGNTKISQTIEGAFVAPDKVKGTCEFSYGSMGTHEGDWEGAPKKKDASTSPATIVPESTVAATKPIPASEPSQTPVQTNTDVTYLSQFQPTIIELGYGTYSVGKFEFSSDDPADDIHYGDPIVFHGIEYTNGIFAHAPSRLVYNLGNQRYTEFIATLGLVEKISCGDGVQFVVLVDGKETYRSKTLYAESAPVDIQISIVNGSELSLVVEMGASSDNGCDWAIWGDPRLR